MRNYQAHFGATSSYLRRNFSLKLRTPCQFNRLQHLMWLKKAGTHRRLCHENSELVTFSGKSLGHCLRYRALARARDPSHEHSNLSSHAEIDPMISAVTSSACSLTTLLVRSPSLR